MLDKIRSRLRKNTSGSSLTVDLGRHYQNHVQQNNFHFDRSQLNVIQHLQVLNEQLQLPRKLFKFNSKPKKITGSVKSHLYIYGDVGQGKSMLMDLFFKTSPCKQKRRVHFHAFMLEVHQFIHDWKKQGDVMLALADKIHQSTKLLCFDEFHITDIADAMIMDRLFRCLFDSGMIIVMTSNRHPTELYQGGLLREQFLPFVKLLQEKVQIIELTGKTDYRRLHQAAAKKCYFYPLNAHAEQQIQNRYKTLTGSDGPQPVRLDINGRGIDVMGASKGVLLASFTQLCENTLGAADYLAIVKRFKTVILSGIPRLSADYSNEARRFEILVDALYEHKVNLICSAVTHPDEIYLQGKGAFEFKRTVSRLIEMQSANYLHLPLSE